MPCTVWRDNARALKAPWFVAGGRLQQYYQPNTPMQVKANGVLHSTPARPHTRPRQRTVLAFPPIQLHHKLNRGAIQCDSNAAGVHSLLTVTHAHTKYSTFTQETDHRQPSTVIVTSRSVLCSCKATPGMQRELHPHND